MADLVARCSTHASLACHPLFSPEPGLVAPARLQLYPTWKGWMWAGVLAIFGYCYAIIHHQLFW